MEYKEKTICKRNYRRTQEKRIRQEENKMGIEYEEIRVVVKNKKTGDEITLSQKLAHEYGTPMRWKTEDFDVDKIHVVHG